MKTIGERIKWYKNLNRLRQQLINLRRGAVYRVIGQAADEFSSDVGRNIRAIENYDRVLAVLEPSRTKKLYVPTFVVLVCITLVWLAWALPLHYFGIKTNLVLNAKADSIKFDLSAPLIWDEGLPLHKNDVNLEEMDELSLPIPGRKIKILKNRAWVQIEQGEVSLSSLKFNNVGKEGSVEIQSNSDGTVIFYVKNLRFHGKLDLRSARNLKAGWSIDEEKDFGTLSPLDPTEIVTFTTDAGYVPATLRTQIQNDLVFYQVPVRGLSFTRQKPTFVGEQTFVSSIIDGDLFLSDTGEYVKLRKGELLTLPNVQGRLAEVRIKDQIHVVFEGSAERIGQGSTNYLRDLTPSLLEYLYFNRSVYLFFTGILFLWSLLWGVRRILYT